MGRATRTRAATASRPPRAGAMAEASRPPRTGVVATASRPPRTKAVAVTAASRPRPPTIPLSRRQDPAVAGPALVSRVREGRAAEGGAAVIKAFLPRFSRGGVRRRQVYVPCQAA
ncbi:hypothetical protein DUI70_3294 [Streptomyces albus]|nr:hypothetical protein DUI70_3294 [Streptomyces albus]